MNNSNRYTNLRSRLGAKKKNKLLFGSPISRKESWARGEMKMARIEVDLNRLVTY